MSKPMVIGVVVLGGGALAVALLTSGGGPASPAVPSVPRQEPPSAAEPPAGGQTIPSGQPPLEADGQGAISGTVLFEGTVPPPPALPVTQDKEKCGLGDTVADESLLVDKETKGLANAVITLEPKEGKKGTVAGEKTVEFDQKKCLFTEHVQVVPAGATVDFKNSDTVGHNVNVQAVKNANFNQTIEGGKSLQKKFDKEERISVTCNIHPWMKGWLVVTDAPFSAKTDAKGGFKIENVPAGTYKVKVWQERIGAKKESWKGNFEVTVKDGETAKLDFSGSFSK